MLNLLVSGEPLLSPIPAVCLLGMTVFGLYYYISFRFEDKQPRIVHGKSELNDYILNKCEHIKTPFNPPFLLGNTHIQTVLPNIVTLHRQVKFRREFLKLSDGEMLALDYPYLTKENAMQEINAETPIMILLPGLTGDAEGISSSCYHALKNNYRTIVFNKRGHGNSKITIPKLQSFGDPSDLRQVVVHLQEAYPNAVIAGIGISAGSGLLACYLGTYTTDPIIQVGVCISPGYDAVPLFNGGFGFPYDPILVKSLKRLIGQHSPTLSKVVNIESIMKAKDLGELEEKVYCKIYGYESMDEYWLDNNPMEFVLKIKVPVLCINSSDDPICLEKYIPYEFFKKTPTSMLINPERGGHVGFLSGYNLETWADKLAVSYVSNVLKFQSNDI